jgi:hypothetical protein
MMQEYSAVGVIEKLRGAFEGLGNQPFPEDSSDDDASQLHAELANFDGYVAGRITTLINGGLLGRTELDSDTILKGRLEALANSNATGSADAMRYLEYFLRLEALLDLGRDLAR